MHHQELHTVSNFSKSRFLKKALQFLLLVSIFSYVFLHAYNLYFISTLNYHFFNYTIDRKYMFLIFNGIIVFLARNSGLIGSSPFQTDLHHKFAKRNGDSIQSQHEFSEMNYVIENEVAVESVEFLENVAVEDEGAEVGNEFLITEVEEEEENGFAIINEEEEEEEGIGLLSTEELNKKFEDFIKRTKEGIRIEAQQQLVMV